MFSVTAGGLDSRGTPSAINICLERVLFGKIQDSDEVDVANHTLETGRIEVYGIGSRRSYAAIVTADKKTNLRRPRRRNSTEWL